jgi:hypothetical protein
VERHRTPDGYRLNILEVESPVVLHDTRRFDQQDVILAQPKSRSHRKRPGFAGKLDIVRLRHARGRLESSRIAMAIHKPIWASASRMARINRIFERRTMLDGARQYRTET